MRKIRTLPYNCEEVISHSRGNGGELILVLGRKRRSKITYNTLHLLKTSVNSNPIFALAQTRTGQKRVPLSVTFVNGTTLVRGRYTSPVHTYKIGYQGRVES